MTAQENIELPMILAGLDQKNGTGVSWRRVEAFGLVNRASHRPDQLSGGQRQRGGHCQGDYYAGPRSSLPMNRPAIWIRTQVWKVIDILEKLNRQGITLIMVTHDQSPGTAGRAQG